MISSEILHEVTLPITINSNDITLRNIEMIIEPLDKIHTKKTVVEYAKTLLEHEIKKNKEQV